MSDPGPRRGRRRRWIPAVAGLAAVVVVVTGAVVAEGYEAQDVPRVESAVWVTRDTGQYARVNTELGELDTVRNVDDPAGVAQSGSASVVFTQGLRRWWPVDPAAPVDLVDEQDAPAGDADAPPAAQAEATPDGTVEIETAGSYVAYRTDAGGVAVATLGDGGLSAAQPLDPTGGEDAPATATADPDADGGDGSDADAGTPAYRADAIAVDADGIVLMYSAAERGVRRFDARTGAFTGGLTRVAEAPKADDAVELVLAGSHWALVDADASRVWIDGRTPVDAGIGTDARVQSSVDAGASILIADSDGLVEVDAEHGTAERLVEASGVPAAPVVVDGTGYAAWIGQTGGFLWTSAHPDTTTPLVGDGDALEQVQSIVPVLRSNGDRVVVNETSSGLVWTGEGRLIPLAQWAQNDDDDDDSGTVQVDDIAEEKPPTALPDAFGVRAGAVVDLPLLLNDSDPNRKDVLSIVPALGALSDPAFGTVGLVADDQRAVITVAAGSGSATFDYQVTDGSAASAPATVTLDVVPADRNTAPVWCPPEDCTLPEPSAQLAPGGTAVLPALRGWVDPEGDPLVLADAHPVEPDAPLETVVTNDGRLALRHTDPNAAGGTIPVVIGVEDSFGARTEQQFDVVVTSAPPLELEPVAVTAAPGEVRTIPIADHVRGGSGSFRLLDAAPSAPIDGLVVAPDAGSGRISVSAAAAGDYVLDYSVQDTSTLAEQTAVLRLTVDAGTGAISAPPLTAFVRPNEDATIDVLGDVEYHGGRVLYVEDVQAIDPALSIDVVDLDRVRVSGTTESGRAGRIGTARIRVADGSGAVADVQLTVFLVTPAEPQAPVAQPDTATVRAGAAIDVDVTANDLAPRGERLVVRPELEGSGDAGELVFTDGAVVRYLASSTPGVRVVRYSVALENDPERMSTATIVITVLPSGANRAPQPPALTARVAAGETVRIPVDLGTADPDGDAVSLVDVAQPEAGVATIAAAGDAIRFRAPDDGVPGGLAGFDYTVRDANGMTATGTVRVAVVPGTSQVQPIAFSDYARVVVGSAQPVVVEPLRNDRDPAGGQLELVSIKPNANDAPGNPEYARLEALIDPATSLPDGKVVLRAGDVAGPASFIVTVRSKLTSSTAEGLLVLNVTRSASADQPVVTDTVVTATNRGQLAGGGIDVVTGKVEWPGGELSGLTLEVWGDAANRYRAEGTRISGPAPRAGALVPFRVSGTDAAGGDVEAYGFLRIPAFADLRLELRGDVQPFMVDEEKSVAFDVRDLVDVPAGESLELRQDDGYRVGRANASCVPTGELRAEYRTGREAPWSDVCLLPVRLEGQDTWSMLPVPIALRPKDPLAILTPVSRTVAPAASETVDLIAAMTSWEGGRVGDEKLLDFRASYQGSAFTVTQNGTSVTAEAHADAKPGTHETISIGVSNFGGLSSTITLVVGIAPPDAPRGATFSTTCDVSTGPNCTVPVVGVAGEYDPFAGKTGSGLKLVALGSSRCEVATVATAGDTAITASWPAGPTPPGGSCTVPFTVADAQGRTGTGTLTIDIQGYPARPESVTTSGYSGDGVMLDVRLGDARLAHPALTGVQIVENGRDVGADCSASGPDLYRCAVHGLANGEQHQYTARAVNQIGASLDTTAVTTWSYQAPAVTDVRVTPVYDANATRRDQGVVEVQIDSTRDARSFRINGGPSVFRTGDTTTTTITLPPGQQLVSVVPSSQFSPPTGNLGNEGLGVQRFVDVAAAPYFDGALTARTPDNTSIIAGGATANANFSHEAVTTLYFAWEQNEPRCTVDAAGGLTATVTGDAVQSATNSITGLSEYRDYRVKACTSNGFGVAESSTAQASTDVNMPAPTGTSEYSVSPAPKQNSRTYSYLAVTPPSLTPDARFWLEYLVGGNWTKTFTLDAEQPTSQLAARQCRQSLGASKCSEQTAITPAAGSAVWTASVTFKPDACVASIDDVTFDRMVDRVSRAAAGNAQLTGIAVNATDPTVVDYVFDWTGPFDGLQQIKRSVSLCPPPPPTEDPEDPADPGDDGAPTGPEAPAPTDPAAPGANG